SSYLQFAADFDGDGRRDIWATPADVFASIANYLKGHGWAANESWGREVKFDADAARRVASTVAHRTGSCSALRDMTVPMSLSEWRRLGAKTLGGARVPKDERKASLVSGRTRHFLVYGNYEALLQYNCAHSYALSVALLGDQLGSTAAVVKSPEKAKRPAPAVSRATTHTRNSRTKH
ncbi:MAG: lytic murein transglycosylase, partial [Vicinamibacterales bacterium]